MGTNLDKMPLIGFLCKLSIIGCSRHKVTMAASMLGAFNVPDNAIILPVVGTYIEYLLITPGGQSLKHFFIILVCTLTFYGMLLLLLESSGAFNHLEDLKVIPLEKLL